MILLTALGWLLVHLGIDLQCLCGDRYSEHQFDRWTPRGICQRGNFRDGCDCMVYEPRMFRQLDPNRGTGM